MQKKITVLYSVNDLEYSVVISYTIEMSEQLQTISCIVNPGTFNFPPWLQLRKFELRSYFSAGQYTPLFSDNSNIKNMNAVLFIDKTYNDIMAQEKFKMALA
jgi:hypothetical protein